MKASSVDLTPAEQRVVDATIEVMNAITDLYGGIPHNYSNEAIPAIHVLQQFARQHWAHQVNPNAWSDWCDSTNLTHLSGS